MALATTGILCCCRKRRSSHRWPPDIAAVVLEERVAEEPKFVEKSAIDRKTQRAEMNEYISTDSKSAAPAAGGSAPSRPSNPVPIKRFQEYVTRALVEGTLELEYTTLRNGRLHPTTVAEKPDNRPRNRDGNILPYDHSRVVLTSDDDIVDYINASYIPGFRNPRRYIAAQSPARTTTSDFWQMVWQENIVKVVALSEPKEEAVYWPESQGKYGSITVTLKKTELKADFAVRELEYQW
ncbi:receptor-type tyrosine-protein phosphatase epsilon-like [Dermacentor silvarum]|uniref:receptor-type tyrosine-protein phosphatase epsilon-like n=1 Tax=Dermacentor silvarum TaxID=543639 RepID=UPI0021015EE8|nr:receptor-type tyrosine-protein phosphatase epsilon-like [Dermacentor silvarum]